MAERRVTRQDLEDKIREVQESISGAAHEATRSVIPIAIAVVLVLLGLSYFLGRRAGRRNPVVVELKRR
jgi:hypothetical protein